jgi:hypothetical protein
MGVARRQIRRIRRRARLGCKPHPCHRVAAVIDLNGVAEDSATVLPRTYESPAWECFVWRISYPAADASDLVAGRLPLRCSTATKHSSDLQGDVRFFARLQERGRPRRSCKTKRRVQPPAYRRHCRQHPRRHHPHPRGRRRVPLRRLERSKTKADPLRLLGPRRINQNQSGRGERCARLVVPASIPASRGCCSLERRALPPMITTMPSDGPAHRQIGAFPRGEAVVPAPRREV